MSNEMTNYRGRFAPSPSGPLHFGSLVAAMGSYLDARHAGGIWLVRMEDLDTPRVKPAAADKILATLEAFGFEWDEKILRQNNPHRSDAYRQALAKLAARDAIYRCACTRKEINESGVPGVEGSVYPGTCRIKPPAGRAAKTIRVRTDDTGIGFRDLICGEIQQQVLSECGDFIVRRADGLVAYQLAVVVDDAFQGINRVVRGADLLFSTPRQIVLQKLLGLPTPEYAHLPLVKDANGRKLSKQSLAQPVNNAHPLPALLAAWRLLGQVKPEHDLGNPNEFWAWAVPKWKLSQVPKDSSMVSRLNLPAV